MESRRALLTGMFTIPTVLVLCFVLLPVVVVIGAAIEPSSLLRFPPSGVSFRWFVAFVHNESFTTALLHVSVPLGLIVAFVSSLIGTAAAIGLVRYEFRGKRSVEFLILLPVIIPQILLAVGLFLLHIWINASLSFASLVIGHVVIATPFVIRTVIAGLSGIDIRLEEAAQNLGAHPALAFSLVTLPLLRGSIVSGAIFAFIMSFSDINLALFLASAGVITLPLQILAQMQVASDPTLAAASAAQIMLISMLLLTIQWLFGRLRV